MKVKVAETAGFCFGVKRAVDKVYELIDTEQKPIFTLGPIIHNEGVVADLEAPEFTHPVHFHSRQYCHEE